MICTVSHTESFYEINKFLLKEALRLDIYNNHNYILNLLIIVVIY